MDRPGIRSSRRLYLLLGMFALLGCERPEGGQEPMGASASHEVSTSGDERAEANESAHGHAAASGEVEANVVARVEDTPDEESPPPSFPPFDDSCESDVDCGPFSTRLGGPRVCCGGTPRAANRTYIEEVGAICREAYPRIGPRCPPMAPARRIFTRCLEGRCREIEPPDRRSR